MDSLRRYDKLRSVRHEDSNVRVSEEPGSRVAEGPEGDGLETSWRTGGFRPRAQTARVPPAFDR